ncbi:MAG: SEC-C domain-containing protein, partial [Lachnospiraceae bacterium]|nr:SEC-C domain-containing protein [Lachnospiraceae bacterium]
LVRHPEDKRCIIKLSDDNRSESEQFIKLEQFLDLKQPFLQQFSITSMMETRQRMDIIKVGRNDPCSCGSGIKFKKCCGKNLYYQHERNIIHPRKKVHLQYEIF